MEDVLETRRRTARHSKGYFGTFQGRDLHVSPEHGLDRVHIHMYTNIEAVHREAFMLGCPDMDDQWGRRLRRALPSTSTVYRYECPDCTARNNDRKNKFLLDNSKTLTSGAEVGIDYPALSAPLTWR